MGLSAAASRQLPFVGWRRGRTSMRPGFALPGGRAASTSSVNWGRTTTPLSEPLTLQLQALLASARGRLAAPPPTPVPPAASLAPPPIGGGAPAAPTADSVPADMVVE
eukprot:2379416-Alexandrium_andersonii.AAC.1